MPDEETPPLALIGSLVWEDSALEKKIGQLREEAAQRAKEFARIGRALVVSPERVFSGDRKLDPQFERTLTFFQLARFDGEPAINLAAIDVADLTEKLRAAIIRKEQVREQLAELGIDPEESERQKNLRQSRSLFHPASALAESEKEKTSKQLGFAAKRPRVRT